MWSLKEFYEEGKDGSKPVKDNYRRLGAWIYTPVTALRAGTPGDWTCNQRSNRAEMKYWVLRLCHSLRPPQLQYYEWYVSHYLSFCQMESCLGLVNEKLSKGVPCWPLTPRTDSEPRTVFPLYQSWKDICEPYNDIPRTYICVITTVE